MVLLSCLRGFGLILRNFGFELGVFWFMFCFGVLIWLTLDGVFGYVTCVVYIPWLGVGFDYLCLLYVIVVVDYLLVYVFRVLCIGCSCAFCCLIICFDWLCLLLIVFVVFGAEYEWCLYVVCLMIYFIVLILLYVRIFLCLPYY